MSHTEFDEEIRVKTFVLQFFNYLARGYFSEDEQNEIHILEAKNIERIELLRNPLKWDGRYDIVLDLIFQTDQIIQKCRNHIPYKQKCADIKIAEYVHKSNLEFWLDGIILNDLKELLDIEAVFKNGHMLHDTYRGYSEPNLFGFGVDCLDFLHSSAHFYNEAYDYDNNHKTIKFYSDKDYGKIGKYELRRIQTKEEVMFRNYREAYINLIFFVESFVNSVGFDAYLAGLGKTVSEENNLRGFRISKKNAFVQHLSFREKIKSLTLIISGLKADTYKDPFQHYISQSVELRNHYVHSSPTKPKIRLTIDDWKKKCDRMIDKECFDFLNAFWKACYGNKVFPISIFNVFYGNSFKGHQGRFMAEST